ncbi:glycoside hydrolase family 2 protein, partial [Fibrobacterota bacterium]
ISLPHVWNMEPDYDGNHEVAFYYKKFKVSENESSKRFFIRFDSVFHSATVWLNGNHLGSHLGGDVQFDMDASKHVKIGENNLLTVRVQSYDGKGHLMDRSFNELPLGAVCKKAPFSGILGDIHFLMGGRAGIRSVLCFPDYEAEQITIETKFWNPKNYKADLEYILTSPDGKTGTLPKFIKLEKEDDTYSITFSLDDAMIWSPEMTNLYKLKVRLLGSYDVNLHFGLRRVEIERCNFKINHRIRKIRAVNFSPLFPFYHAIPPFKYDLGKDLQMVKDMGFNLIRSGGVPLKKETLDICDKLGIMVIQETTCYNQKSSKEGLDELKEQVKSLILSTGYHPCIIAWGIGAENGSMVLENGNKLLRYTCEIDPYRPIISNLNSVFIDSNGIGKIDLGKVFNPTEAKIAPFESHKMKLAAPISTGTQNLLTNYCSTKDARSINDKIHGNKSFWEQYNYLKDELGGKILVDGLGINVPQNLKKIVSSSISKKFAKSDEVRNLKEFRNELNEKIKKLGIWKNAEEFLIDAAKICQSSTVCHLESLLVNSQISGYIFEQWADFGNNFSGLVDWFRNPKPDMEYVKKLNQKCKIMSKAKVRTPYMGTSAAIDIYMLNETGLEDYGLLIRVKGPNGRIWHQESMPGTARPGLNSIGRFKFPVGMEKGWFTFDLTLSQGKKEIDKKEEVFFVPPKVKMDPLFSSVCFKGGFAETVTYSSDKDSNIIIAKDIHQLPKNDLHKMFEKANNGSILVLGGLTQEDAQVINKLKTLPFEISCFRTSRTSLGSFHYILHHPEFKHLPDKCLIGQAFSDIIPPW